MKALVTGANGYLGRHLVACLLKLGAEVICGARHLTGLPDGAQWIQYRLEDAEFVVPDGVSHIFHLALSEPSTLSEKKMRQMALQAVQRLINTSSNAHIVFPSSQVAQKKATSPYGRSKFECEKMVLSSGGTVLRLGLVYGGDPAGLYARLDMLANNLPILPIFFFPTPKIHPVHVNEVANAMVAASDEKHAGKMYMLGSANSIPFHNFLGTLRRLRHRKLPLYMIFPSGVITAIASRLPKFVSKNPAVVQLRSLLTMPSLNASSSLNALSLSLSDYHDILIEEMIPIWMKQDAAALLKYLLGQKPDEDLVKRAVLYFQEHTEIKPKLPGFFVRHPAWLGVFEYSCSGEKRNHHREVLRCLTLISECSQQGANRFLGSPDGTGMFNTILSLTLTVFEEMFAMFVGTGLRLLLLLLKRARA